MRSIVVALAILGSSATAVAQDPAPRPNVVRLPDIEIMGRRQMPVSYVLSRSGDDYEVRELRTSFVPRVIRSVERGPF